MTVKLIIVNTDECRGLLSEPERFCSALRLERTAVVRNEKQRLERYAAELALSFAMSGEDLLPPVYSYEASGKPVIENGYVSLTHSGNYAVCAYADAPVGVDIEMRRSVSARLARRILSEEEYTEYKNGGGNDYLLERFVMKEAYFKMTGEGLGGRFGEADTTNGMITLGGEPAGFMKRFGGGEFIGYAVCGMEFNSFTIQISDSLLLRKERTDRSQTGTVMS